MGKKMKVETAEKLFERLFEYLEKADNIAEKADAEVLEEFFDSLLEYMEKMGDIVASPGEEFIPMNYFELTMDPWVLTFVKRLIPNLLVYLSRQKELSLSIDIDKGVVKLNRGKKKFTIAEMIERILKMANRPLTLKTIRASLCWMKFELISNKTITSVLTKSKRFKKFSGKRWGLSEWDENEFPPVAEVEIDFYNHQNKTITITKALSEIIGDNPQVEVIDEFEKKYVFHRASGYLTGVASFFKEHLLQPGDMLLFTKMDGKIRVFIFPYVYYSKYFYRELDEKYNETVAFIRAFKKLFTKAENRKEDKNEGGSI